MNNLKRYLPYILLFVIGAAVYANTLRNGFVWDDLLIIHPNEYIRSWEHIGQLFVTDVHHFAIDKSNFYRPLQMLTFMLDYSVWQFNPVGYHITNTFLHIMTGWAVFAVLNVLFVSSSCSKETGRKLALGAALLWLVHPVHTQCTTYVSGRADILVTLFILLTVLAYIKEKRGLSILCFVLALLSKELAVLAPLFIILYDVILRHGQKINWKRYVPYILVLAGYIGLRLTILNFPSAFNTDEIPGLYSRILTAFHAVVILWGSLIFPFKLSMIRNIPFEHSLLDWQVILSVLCVFFVIGLALVKRKQYPLVAFGVLWFFIGYVPGMNIVAMNANASEHWLYLPSIGFFMAIVWIIGQWSVRHTFVFSLIIGILAIGWGGRLIVRNTDFKDEITFYERTLKTNPNHARIVYNLGTAYAMQNDFQRAEPLFERAIELKSTYGEAYGNLGLIYAKRGEFQKAIVFHEQANRFKPGLVENYVNLGNAYAQTGRGPEAVEQFQKALAINPNHTSAINGIGIEQAKIKKYELAEQLFKKVLQLDPDNVPAQKNLNRLYALMNPSR
jgi:Flp pilus assembly protein TadD